jgi:integrase/recombinase XerD
MKSRDISLFPLIHDYLKIYLPKQRNVSPNTIRSYRKALEELLDYAKTCEQIPLNQITFEHLSADRILSFLEYLEVDKGCSIPTRNTRFAAIRAFMDYAADHDIALVANLSKLKRVPFKKPNSKVLVDYISMAAITAIIEQPDTSTPKGLRDQFFMILLYDTGARVQEILDIKLCDLQLGPLPKVTLLGKGRKTRIVPLMEKTVQHLKKYLAAYHADSALAADSPLFYSVTHDEKHPLTPRTAQYILQKYGERARKTCQEVPPKVHPHLFRHSRAMHLYQEGMDLTLVSQWLGHSQLETTQIYAHADTEHKRRAIANATPKDNPLYSKLNSARYTVTDEDTLKKLTGLR